MGPAAERLESLYAEIENNPDDPAAYLVLGDALLESGDARGELIGVQHALLTSEGNEATKLRKRERELLGTQREALLGKELAAAKGVALDWRLGFVTHATVPVGLPLGGLQRVIKTLLSSPASRLLRGLTLTFPARDRIDHPVRDLLGQLARSNLRPPPGLRTLTLGTAEADRPGYWVYSDYEACALLDDLSGLFGRFDRLEQLRVDAGVASLRWGAIESQTLRDFEWVTPHLSSADLQALVQGRWPRLRRIVVWTGGQTTVNTEDELHVRGDDGFEDDFDENAEEGAVQGGGDDDWLEWESLEGDALAPLFDSLDKLDELEVFGVANYVGSWGELAQSLRGHSLWSRIHTLDMSRARILAGDTDPLLAALREAPALRTVVIDQARIDPGALDALRRLQLTLEGASRGLAGDLPAEDFRYVVTME